MLRRIKQSLRKLALERWASSAYSPNGTPPPLYRQLSGGSGLTYIDVGAFDGNFFGTLSEIARFKRAILVEPQPALAARLRSRFPRAEVFEYALSNIGGSAEFNNYPRAPYMSSLLKLDDRVVDHSLIAKGDHIPTLTQSTTLDNLASDLSLGEVDLIKIDTQGTELEVLKGGIELLKRTVAVWVEVSFVRLYENACLFHEIVEVMRFSQFELKALHSGWRTSSGELMQADALFVRKNAADRHK